MQVELDFPFFALRELDEENGCLDYLEIHEGDGNTERFIGRYCGTKLHFHASSSKKLGWYMGFQANVKQRGELLLLYQYSNQNIICC